MLKRLAYMVHIFTAAGAWAGIKACMAITRGEYNEAFLFMFLAVFIDSVDGTFARALKVWERCPEIDGRRLDDMVDYFTWVIIPVFFMAHAGLLPNASWLWALPLICSAMGMANLDAKTEDDYFRGFPSLWNFVALYLWKAGLPADLNAGIIVALSLSVLAPVRFIYPSKTPYLRGLTIGMMSAWLVLSGLGLWLDPPLGRTCFLLSLIFPIYYVGLSAYLNFVPKAGPAEGASGGKGK